MRPVKIGYAGTDGRSLLAALETSRAKSDLNPGSYQGVVVRGTPAMQPWAKQMGWPVDFIPTTDNSASAYAEALIRAFERGDLDIALVMPEGLLFEGLVDKIAESGYGNRVIGLDRRGAFIEGDKIACKEFCMRSGIPVAEKWAELEVRDYSTILGTCSNYLHNFGGAVLKYPYSAGGKGAREILSTWDIGKVYNQLRTDYDGDYIARFGERGRWPLLIESRMAGVEISFTTLVDGKGSYQMLPTSMDYPRRFKGPPSNENPVTGGMGAVSPHPMESPELLKLAEKTIIQPLIKAMREKEILRPCALYPGCFVSFDEQMRPIAIRVCEINIRPGEPEFQPVVKRLRNLGALVQAMIEGNLDKVRPEVREDQISMCIALVTGPGGPKGQKGYPWSLTKGEPLEVDFDYFEKKKITVVSSAMDYKEGIFKSDGSRVAFLVANAAIKPGESPGKVAETLRQKIYGALLKIRVIPRENADGNRLACRWDIGSEYDDVARMMKPF